MDSAYAVRTRGITKSFREVVALDGVDLDIAAGQVHGLVGPNGAGKTTLMSLLLGLADADAGSLEILGEPHRGSSVPAGVAGFVDGPGLYPALTARANLAALAALQGYGRSAAIEVDRVLHAVGLEGVVEDRVRGFSLGMRQRLGLAAALLARPRLLILDEPANGLDPAGRHHVHAVLRDLAEQGCTILLSSHRLDDLAALCAEVTILSTGRVTFTGPIAKLVAETGPVDFRVIDATGHEQVVTGTDALDSLIDQILSRGGALREVVPVVAPLEAAYLALTGSRTASEDPYAADGRAR